MAKFIYMLAVAAVLASTGGCSLLSEQEFDGHKYIVSAGGGVVHSPKCGCQASPQQIKVEGETLILGAKNRDGR